LVPYVSQLRKHAKSTLAHGVELFIGALLGVPAALVIEYLIQRAARHAAQR